MAQWYQFVIHLGTDTVGSQEGMDGEGKVQGCTACRHRLDLTFRCEDKDFRCKQVQLDSIQEVHGVRLWVVQDLLDGVQPVVQLVFILCVLTIFALLVFPVGGKALFGYLVHAVRAYLHFNPSSLFGHQGHMQGLIAIGFRM